MEGTGLSQMGDVGSSGCRRWGFGMQRPQGCKAQRCQVGGHWVSVTTKNGDVTAWGHRDESLWMWGWRTLGLRDIEARAQQCLETGVLRAVCVPAAPVSVSTLCTSSVPCWARTVSSSQERRYWGHVGWGGMWCTGGTALRPLTVSAVPAGAAGTVGWDGLQCHAATGAGGECRGSGGCGAQLSLLTPLLCQGLSRETAKRLRFVPGLIYIDGKARLISAARPHPSFPFLLWGCGTPRVSPCSSCCRCAHRGSSVRAEPGATGANPDPHGGPAAGNRLPLLPGLPGAGGDRMGLGSTMWGDVSACTQLPVCPQALELPGSILRRGPGGDSEPSPSYKAAVEGFIQQQRQEEANGDGGTSPAGLGTQDGPAGGSHAHLPAAARTEELLRLFDAAETLTAKEELLQMLR